MESGRAALRETVDLWLPGPAGQGSGKVLVKGYELLAIRQIHSGDPMVALVNNTVLYT